MEHGSRTLRRLISGFYLFYIRILIPAAISSLIIGLTSYAMGGKEFLDIAAYSFLISSPAFHFIQYDFMNSGQYYFYNNLGFTRLGLWILSVCTSVLIFITAISL